MPVVIEVELLAGRYHAHVWGEAQFAMAGAEWPPSPWRLLRALASAWFETRPAPSTTADRDGLIEALGCSRAPEIWLPATTFREIRYYQPLEQKRALHHDFFAVPAGHRFYFVFEASLNEGHQQLLDTLLKRVQYFGRAESRATLQRVTMGGPPSGFFRVLPRERAAGTGWSPRPVLCPSHDFRASDLWAPREPASSNKGKKAKKAANENGAPVHLVDALLSARKPLPDGSSRIEYAQPDGSLVHEIPSTKTPRSPITEIVDTRSVRLRLCRRIPIAISDVVAVARAYRDAVAEIFKAANPGIHSRALTGREDDGSVSRGNRHAYYLPQPSAPGIELSALLVVVPSEIALTRLELDALLAVERVRLRWNDRYPITVIPEVVNGDRRVASERWRSITPFLPPHHHRAGHNETCTDQHLLSCIQNSCGVAPVRIAPISGPAGMGSRTLVRAHEYASAVAESADARSWRLTRRFAQWFSVEFSAPVVLAHAVGKDAHFGLGQFTPG